MMLRMSTCIIICILSFTYVCDFPVMGSSRTKRHALQLSTLISKYTRYNPYKLTGYGNWCGRGGDRQGDGSYIDKCDQCCKNHDNCYRQSRKEPPFCTAVIFRIYNYEVTEHGDPYCTDNDDDCDRALCECDMKLVKCLGKEPCKLNDQNSGSTLSLLFRWAPFLESFG